MSIEPFENDCLERFQFEIPWTFFENGEPVILA